MTGVVELERAQDALRERIRTLPADGDIAMRLRRLRMLLQEMGISCDDSADLQDLDAVLFVSERGAEALVASRLDDEERVVAYARLIARLLADNLQAPVDIKIEYTRSADAPSRREREEERMVMALANAIAYGRLDEAPRPLYEDVPHFTFAFTPRSAARSTLGGFHLWSGFWYRRSNMYRRWRSRRGVSDVIGRVCVALTRASITPA